MPDHYLVGEKGKRGERNGKGEEGQEGGKVGGKLEQGRRLAKAGPDWALKKKNITGET